MESLFELSEAFLQLSKILVTMVTVIGLAWVAERISTRWASLLSGFPLGTAIALVYLGIEQGAEFAGQSAQYTLLGFISAQWLSLAYLLACRWRYSLMIAPIAAISCFALCNWILGFVSLDLWGNFALCSLTTALFAMGYRYLPSEEISRNTQMTPAELFIRALASALIIVLITLLGHLGNSLIAGLFAAFPITYMPLLVIIHYHYGRSAAKAMIKYYPLGLGALIIHTLIVALSYANDGIMLGTLFGFLGAIGYLGMLALLRRQPSV